MKRGETADPRGVDIDDVLRQLDELEQTVSGSEEQQEVNQTREMLKRLPGGDRIRKYTSRDIAGGFVAAGTMFMWGRLHLGDPTTLEQIARISVVWTATAVGATLGDILPGESQGEDLTDRLEKITALEISE